MRRGGRPRFCTVGRALPGMPQTGAKSANFGFLLAHDPLLDHLGALADRYFTDDPSLSDQDPAVRRSVRARAAHDGQSDAAGDRVQRGFVSRGQRGVSPGQHAALLYVGVAPHADRPGGAGLCAGVRVAPAAGRERGLVSELRGLSSAAFGLVALNLLVVARGTADAAPARWRALLALSAVAVAAAMLCKPAAAILPVVALVIDRVALGTPWKRSAVLAAIWSAAVVPFALVTRAVQTIHPQGASLWWQRPFIAGDALAFYLRKTVLPVNLTAEYGRTPAAVMSHGWSYLVWRVPAGLLVLAFRYRHRHRIAWLGALLFCTSCCRTWG